MDLPDRVTKDAVKTTKDTQLFQGTTELVDEKVKEFSVSGIDGLIASGFQAIKSFIGKFISKITNSINIVEENSKQFFDKVTEGLEKIPEDLKDIDEDETETTTTQAPRSAGSI